MYNALIDIALIGCALLILGIIIAKEPKVKRGAAKMNRNRIRMMQKCRDYTVSGNGVAHRTSSSYMRDVKVRAHLVKCARSK